MVATIAAMDHTRSTAHKAVTRVLTVELVGPDDSATLEAELRYDAGDPHAATISFPSEAGVAWTFGRDLLVDGLYEPTGLGDVHLQPSLDLRGRAVVVIELHTPGGVTLIQARTKDLREFVDQMTTLVPRGTESQHLNIDATVTAILAAHRTE